MSKKSSDILSFVSTKETKTHKTKITSKRKRNLSTNPLSLNEDKNNHEEPQSYREEPKFHRVKPDGFSRLIFLKSALKFFKSTLDFVRFTLVFLKSAQGRDFDRVEHEKVARK